MKRFVSVLAVAALAGGAYGQLNPVPGTDPNIPPSSRINGQITQPQWLTSDLQHYVFASDLNLGTPSPTASGNFPTWNDNTPLNLQWGIDGPTSQLAALNAEGGTVRAILLGESAGWSNHFGYTLGPPEASATSTTTFSLLNNIQYTTNPDNFQYHYFDIALAAGEASGFDFWLSGVGNYPGSPSYSQGGFYSVFNNLDPSYNNPLYVEYGNVRWTLQALLIDTEIPDLTDPNGGTIIVPVETWLVGLEDYNLPNSDQDFNDFLFAIQFFQNDGTPFTPVPEPSTYGLIGAGALLGFVAFRRFQAKRKAQAAA